MTMTAVLLAFLVGLATANPAKADTIAPWAGLVYQGLRDPADGRTWSRIAGVEANISIPCLSDFAPNGAYHAWVGLGGANSQGIIRAGLSAQMARTGSTPVKIYTLWAEFRPGSTPGARLGGLFGGIVSSLLTLQPPAPTIVEQTGGDLCNRNIPIEVRSNGTVFLNGRERPQLGAPSDLTTAEYILQADGMGSTLASTGGTVSFTGAIMSAYDRSLNRYGVGDTPSETRSFAGIQPTHVTASSFDFSIPPYRPVIRSYNPGFPG